MHVDMPKLGIYLVEYKSNQLWLYIMIVVLDHHDNNNHLQWWSNEGCNATRACPKPTAFKLDSPFCAQDRWQPEQNIEIKGVRTQTLLAPIRHYDDFMNMKVSSHMHSAVDHLLVNFTTGISKQVHLPLRALQLYILYRICRHSTDPEWSDGTFVISLLGIYK